MSLPSCNFTSKQTLIHNTEEFASVAAQTL